MPFFPTPLAPPASRAVSPSMRPQLRARSVVWVSYAVQQTPAPFGPLSVPSATVSASSPSFAAETSRIGAVAQVALAVPTGYSSTAAYDSDPADDGGEEDWEDCEEDAEDDWTDDTSDHSIFMSSQSASAADAQPTSGLLDALDPLLDTASNLLRRDPNKWWTPSPSSDWSDWDTWSAAPTDTATSFQDGQWTPSPTTPPIASATDAQAALQIPSNLSLDPSQAALASAALAALTSLGTLPPSGVAPLVARPLSARPSATAIVLPVVIAAVILLIALVMCLRGRSKSKTAADEETNTRAAAPPVSLGDGVGAGLTPGVTVTRKDTTLNVEYTDGHGYDRPTFTRDPEKQDRRDSWSQDESARTRDHLASGGAHLDRPVLAHHTHIEEAWDSLPLRPVSRTPPTMTSLASLHLGSSRCFSSDDYLGVLPGARTASRASACSCPSCRPRSALTRLSTRCRSAFSRSDRTSLLSRRDSDCLEGSLRGCECNSYRHESCMSSSRSAATIRNPFESPLDARSRSSTCRSTRSRPLSPRTRSDDLAYRQQEGEVPHKEYRSSYHSQRTLSPPLPPRPISPETLVSSRHRNSLTAESTDTYTTSRQPSTRTRKLQRLQEIDAERDMLSREVEHLQSQDRRHTYTPHETLHRPASMTRHEGISRATGISRVSGVSHGSRAEMGELYEALRVAIGEGPR